jgi:hypothetical protein
MSNSQTSCYIVTKSTYGEDRVFSGVVAGERTWTLQPEKMMRFSAALALELIRDFADEIDSRVHVASKQLGPKVVCASNHKIYIV